jgi:hypothetical protein
MAQSPQFDDVGMGHVEPKGPEETTDLDPAITDRAHQGVNVIASPDDAI